MASIASDIPEYSDSIDADSAVPHALAKNALGLRQILFCIVTGSAPLAAMMFNDPVAIRGAGIGAPAAFILAAVVLVIFSVGYVEMAKRVTTAGGFYSFISRGMGPSAGLGAALSIAVAYIVFTAGVIGTTAYFATTGVQSLLGPNIDWRIYAFVGIGLLFILSFFHVEFAAKVLGVSLLCELLILGVFSFAVLFQGGTKFSFAPLNPAEIFGGSANEAFLGLGGAAAGIGLFAAFWSWVGFEMAPNYAEEAKEPKKMMGRAIYISCIGLGILYTFVCWMLVIAYGGNKSTFATAASYYGLHPQANAVRAGLSPNADLGNIFYPMTTEFVGHWLTTLFKIFIITGSFACALAFHNTSCRYLFAMGREGILPRSLGKTHPRYKSPYMAAIVVSAITIVLVGLFATGVAGTFNASDPLVALANLGTWLPFQGVLALLLLQALVSVAIIIYFRRPENADGRHWFKTMVAPILATITQLAAVYLMIANRTQLAGDVPYVRAMPYIVPAIFLVGMLLAAVYRSKANHRYVSIGRFVQEEA
jgi:amino acid transporter